MNIKLECKGFNSKKEAYRHIGLYQKYRVERMDKSEKHQGCAYFVLDMTTGHDPYAVPAIRAYADACEKEYPFLAKDLRKWLKLQGGSDE